MKKIGLTRRLELLSEIAQLQFDDVRNEYIRRGLHWAAKERHGKTTELPDAAFSEDHAEFSRILRMLGKLQEAMADYAKRVERRDRHQ